MKHMNNILIAGAHFDDAELGAGATAAKMVDEGKNVYKITLTDNVTHFSEKGIEVDYESSMLQSRAACRILGVKELDFETEACSHLTYSTDVMQRIEAIVFQYHIDTFFMHFSSDMNQDHIAANKLCLTAARHCRNIIQFQSNGYVLDNVYYPSYFVDVTDYIEKKREALSCYSDAHNRFNRLFETSIDRCRVWGYANEVEYAEGFNVIKMLD
ncbi:PIG-L deacetylase family protein [Otoolea muris]|uniref:PIG-L deacetylase family protein n=1 Tax=Otoolea muris TaxID=2941515 RepID=UPI00203C3EED|nr:PIG-L family deacetylase [Otoolea muris]